MHGNAAEWTLTNFTAGEKTVKGGSFLDRPDRAGINVKHGFPAWQNVHNTGFRIVVNKSKCHWEKIIIWKSQPLFIIVELMIQIEKYVHYRL